MCGSFFLFYQRSKKNPIFSCAPEVNSKSIKPFNFIFFYFEDTLPENRFEEQIMGAIVLVIEMSGRAGCGKYSHTETSHPAGRFKGTTTYTN